VGFRVFCRGGYHIVYFAYLDEFGHIGPYVHRDDPQHNDSPVFGFAGFIIPANQIRAFGTWFFQLKCGLLDFEIKQANAHPANWEKKGASLYTTRNVTKYPELRGATNRILGKFEKIGGHVFYVGVDKVRPHEDHNAQQLYMFVFREAMKRLNQYAEQRNTELLIVMDEHQDRDKILTTATQQMYGADWRNRIIEPPFQVESHRYQTSQCADWICGLVGRFGSYWARPDEFEEMSWTEKYFGSRLKRASISSGIRVFR